MFIIINNLASVKQGNPESYLCEVFYIGGGDGNSTEAPTETHEGSRGGLEDFLRGMQQLAISHAAEIATTFEDGKACAASLVLTLVFNRVDKSRLVWLCPLGPPTNGDVHVISPRNLPLNLLNGATIEILKSLYSFGLE